MNRIAQIRQSQSRFYFTAAKVPRTDRASSRVSRIGRMASRMVGGSPFACPLRPNLASGTLGRSAAGFSAGAARFGGARYFSNGPAHPSQVINNVSASARAFWLSGKRAKFDGYDCETGRKQYRVIDLLEEHTHKKQQIPSSAGSHIDFELSPTITAFGCFSSVGSMSSLSEVHPTTLNTENFLDLLSIDFGRALKDLTTTLADMKRLSTLGDLPISLINNTVLRVSFPGTDAESVERLCKEFDIQRGVISEDDDFGSRSGSDIALRFPFAPSRHTPRPDWFSMEPAYPDPVNWLNMLSDEGARSSGGYSSSPGLTGQEYHIEFGDSNPWASPSSDFDSVDISDLGDRVFFPDIIDDAVQSSSQNLESDQVISLERLIRSS